jgi:hypothetical protein
MAPDHVVGGRCHGPCCRSTAILFLALASISLIHSTKAADTVVGHWADHGFANTTTAGNALSIDAVVTVVRDDDDRLFIVTSM